MEILWWFLCIMGFYAIIGLMGLLAPRRWPRERTWREEALHDQIQRAMNWEPGFPPDDAEWVNNTWTDPDTGKVWRKLTLREIMEDWEKEHPCKEVKHKIDKNF